MNYSSLSIIASDEVRCVACSFYQEDSNNGFDYNTKKYEKKDTKLYTYKTKDTKLYTYKTIDKTIEVGDLVVVQCRGVSTNYGFSIVRVEEVDVDADLSSDLHYKWVVAKIDTSMFEETIKREKLLIKEVKKLEMANKKAQLKEALGLSNLNLSISFSGEV